MGHIVVVDVETNGLDVAKHQVVEAAWWNLDTGERDDFIPTHSVSHVLSNAELKALQVNRYVDRIADRAGEDSTAAEKTMLQALDGATLLGSNVQFDAAMLTKLLGASPWHYRLWEIGSYAAGVLGLDHIPGLWELTQLYGLPENDHTAAGDVTLTGQVFQRLRKTAAGRAD